MPLPKPEPGLVLSYRYLWRNEHEAGRVEGAKVRPCVIVVAVVEAGGQIATVVAPLTHTRPIPPREGIEIPPRVKQHLGLDWERSWVIVDDLNAFIWPGFDLESLPGEAGRFDYGFLPPKLFNALRDRILALGSPERRSTPRDI